MSDLKSSHERLTEIHEQRQTNLKRKHRTLLAAGIQQKELIRLMGELTKSEFVDPKQYTSTGSRARPLAQPDRADEPLENSRTASKLYLPLT